MRRETLPVHFNELLFLILDIRSSEQMQEDIS